jgi:hypothetical protein
VKNIFCVSLFFYAMSGFTSTYAEDLTVRPEGQIESPYEACKEVVIVDKEKYDENIHQNSWKAWEAKCHKKVQVALAAGFTQLGSLDEAPQYLNLASKVAEKVVANLDKSLKYAQCSSACFNRVNTCAEVSCTERRNEILQNLKVQSRKVRMELALSQEATDLIQINVGNVLSLDDDKRFNKNLRDFEAGTPNPLGHVAMQPAEIDHAREIVKRERAEVEKDYKAMLVEKNAKDSPDLYNGWVSKKLMEKIEKRQEEHQLKYRQLVFEESPIFAVIDKPTSYENGDVPVWTEKQIGEAFSKLSKNAETTKAIVKESLAKGKLEFSRTKGEALGLWLKDLIPGTQNSNDLLYYMGMKNQVEEVLKEDKSMCAAATTMANRLSSKDMQNLGVVFAGSFAGGAITKGASKGVVAVFRIGRALSGAEAGGLTGLAIGSAYLGDSFRQYNTAVTEVTSKVRSASELDAKRTNVKFNLAFAPFIGPSGWGLGKTVYNALGKKMAKDFPEIASLMKKAGTSQAAKDEVVDKWMLAKVKKMIKVKTLDAEDEALLKSEAGGKILDSLAADIEKSNPSFFKDPNNFDFFLKTAATSLKKKPGDPADLGVKSRQLFLSLNPEAFASWDPKARMGLMKVFNEGVEELRMSYAKDPAVYAKFGSDSEAQDKIMTAALKRSGVVDDADAAVMRRCAIK